MSTPNHLIIAERLATATGFPIHTVANVMTSGFTEAETRRILASAAAAGVDPLAIMRAIDMPVTPLGSIGCTFGATKPDDDWSDHDERVSLYAAAGLVLALVGGLVAIYTRSAALTVTVLACIAVIACLIHLAATTSARRARAEELDR